jgi:hypothetical protein
LELLLHEPGVTDALVNGPNQVFIDRGAGLELTDPDFQAKATHACSPPNAWPLRWGGASTKRDHDLPAEFG